VFDSLKTTLLNVKEKFMGVMTKVPDKLVLSEAEAIELLAFLLSSARTQVDEPRIYGSMRLLTAAENLRDLIQSRVSSSTGALLEGTTELSLHAQVNMLDAETYTKDLDELCRMVAKFVIEQSDLEEKA
jgi:hypothetical protein